MPEHDGEHLVVERRILQGRIVDDEIDATAQERADGVEIPASRRMAESTLDREVVVVAAEHHLHGVGRHRRHGGRHRTERAEVSDQRPQPTD